MFAKCRQGYEDKALKMKWVSRFVNSPFKYHVIAGAIVRLILILYGNYHDRTYDVPYTDVDYKVFSDAARHVSEGESPYKRHTYRYSPLIAYLLVPNIIFGKDCGKFLFSLFDILIAISIKVLVEQQWRASKDTKKVSSVAAICSMLWLYNPLSIAISTRGNADSVPCFFIIMSIYFLQSNAVRSLWKYVLSGLFLGISIHLRLYPLVFSFPMYLSLGQYKINRQTKAKDGLLQLLPNAKQIILACSCVISLFLLTFSMYLLYGYEFLFETYIYHLFRKDTRHNFSVLFYYLYLTADQLIFDVVKTVALLFECVILFVLSLTFGCNAESLPFALFCQAVVLVAFNSVMTSQYFIWFLSLLPLVAHNLKVSRLKACILTLVWMSAQASWLLSAYLLEFKSRDVFIRIWLKCVVFFCANIYILAQLVKSYTPDYGFGQMSNSVASTKTK